MADEITAAAAGIANTSALTQNKKIFRYLHGCIF